MDRAVTAFLRALRSQLHPKMLALLLVPFVVAIVFWVVVALLVWDPLIDWLRAAVLRGRGAIANWIYGQAERFGLEGLGAWSPRRSR